MKQFFLKYINYFKTAKVWNLIGAGFIIIGILIASPLIYFHITNSGTAAANSTNENNIIAKINSTKRSNQNLVTGFPTAISIPGTRPILDINVGIIPGYYNKSNNSWTLTETSAQFATMSSQPNNITGNTFIYGHYRPNVFAYLHLIPTGTIATITTNNGYQFKYKYIGTYAVQPTITGVLNNSNAPILTLQTCSGTFFQNRQMYIFSYQSYNKINS